MNSWGTFRREWLKEIPQWDFRVPEEYDLNNFVNWKKYFYIDERNLISSSNDKYGKVYDVGEGLVAKVFKKSPFVKKGMVFGTDNFEIKKAPYFIEREFWMTKKLKEAGVNVPFPEGLFLVYDEFLDEYKPGFVMEKINKIDYNRFANGGRIELLINQELNKAKKEGFIIGIDAEWSKNNLLSKDNGKIYPIDFMFWGIK
jgi:hypothetical protein